MVNKLVAVILVTLANACAIAPEPAWRDHECKNGSTYAFTSKISLTNTYIIANAMCDGWELQCEHHPGRDDGCDSLGDPDAYSIVVTCMQAGD